MNTKTKKRVVVVGGGTGTYTVLTGLKKYSDTLDLTAIVAMTDSGGSTGRLRDEFGYLPVGDVRMALTALAHEGDEEDALLRKLFLHRFATNGNISGHNFGSLFLVALTDILGSEESAIEAASRVLRVCGTVLPVTHEKVHLVAEYSNGERIVGEHEIDEPNNSVGEHKITSLSITPKATLNTKAREALLQADLIICGPGDLYTSVLANCVVDGFSDVLKATKGKMVYISNLMTKFGQTTGMGVKGHMHELARYSGRIPDFVLVNTATLPDDLLSRYESEREYPLVQDCESNECRVIADDFLASEEVVRGKGDVLKRSLIRHDPHKLASAIVDLLH